jgi:hypothetical protein
MHRLTILERAFELAQTGPCETFDELRKQLKAEGYDSASQMSFPALKKQLSKIIQARRAAAPAAAPTDACA